MRAKVTLLLIGWSCYLHALAYPALAASDRPRVHEMQNTAEPADAPAQAPLDLSPRQNIPQPRAWQGAQPSLGPMWNLILGLGSRGTVGESKEFETSLGFELGLGIPVLNGFDLGLAAGQFLEEGKTTRVEGVVRYFFLWPQGGPYIGGGLALRNERPSAEKNKDTSSERGDFFGTLGLFGGEGLYCEFDFRKSAWRPVAMIFEFGLRFRPDIFQPTQSSAQGPLVKFLGSPSVSLSTFEH